MTKIAHYVILVCPKCTQRHVRAEFASISDPIFARAFDPPEATRICKGCSLPIALGDFERLEIVSVKDRFRRFPPRPEELPPFLKSDASPKDTEVEAHLPELF